MHIIDFNRLWNKAMPSSQKYVIYGYSLKRINFASCCKYVHQMLRFIAELFRWYNWAKDWYMDFIYYILTRWALYSLHDAVAGVYMHTLLPEYWLANGWCKSGVCWSNNIYQAVSTPVNALGHVAASRLSRSVMPCACCQAETMVTLNVNAANVVCWPEPKRNPKYFEFTAN